MLNFLRTMLTKYMRKKKPYFRTCSCQYSKTPEKSRKKQSKNKPPEIEYPQNVAM